MRIDRKNLAIGLLILGLAASRIEAQFYSLETDHLRLVYYGKIHNYLVSHVARCFENSFRFHSGHFDYNPKDKVTVLLHDFTDYGSAGAGAIPRNHIIISIAPYRYVFETSPANERMNSNMNHELVHITMIDKPAGIDKFYRSLFAGKVLATTENPLTMWYSYLTTPRRFSPRWYNEGIAVFMETWMAGGLGRSLSPYDEMVFRTMIRDQKPFYDYVGLESQGTKLNFQVGVVSYLYGTRFMGYLANKYDPESLIRWTSRTKDSKKYFASQFKKTYGVSIDKEWSRWVEWERKFQNANLDSIRVSPTTSYRQISPRPLGSVSRGYYDGSTGQYYAAIRYPGQIAHLAAIDVNTGRLRRLGDIKGAGLYQVTSLAFDPSTMTLFYTIDNNAWRDLKALNLETGETTTLLKDERVGDIVFNQADRSLWGVRHFNGICTLVRIPHPYQEWNQIWTFPYAKNIFDIDIAPDGSYITASYIEEASGKVTLIGMDVSKLMSGDQTFEELIDFEESTPSNFVFSQDGRTLLGTSYYTGVSNVWRHDLESQKTEIISNCETGFFRPIPVSEDSLIVLRYSEDGFIPVMIANQPLDDVNSISLLGQDIIDAHPVLDDWLAGRPGSIDLEELTTRSDRYSGFQSIKVNSLYPIAEGYKVYPAFGLRLNLSGPIALHNFVLSASYTPNENLAADERWHGHFSYSVSNWKFKASYNAADFYDLFGPTKTSRKGYSFSANYTKTLIFDTPKKMDYNIYVAGYGGLERLPDYQNIQTTFDKLLTARIRFSYEYLRSSLGAVDPEKGFKWEVFSTNNYVNGTLFPLIYTNFDLGIPLRISHSSIWFRSSLGYSFGDRNDPFANFYFGGFGNNWVDYQSARRYREFYSFPGLEINEIGGSNFAKFMLEWNLPPVNFRRFGVPEFYSSWAQLAVFSSGIFTNLDDDPTQRSLVNFGAQLDFQLIIMAYLKAKLSFGYAIALEKNQTLSREFMVSLKIQ